MRARRAGAARAGEVFASHPSRSCPSHLRPSHPSESTSVLFHPSQPCPSHLSRRQASRVRGSRGTWRATAQSMARTMAASSRACSTYRSAPESHPSRPTRAVYVPAIRALGARSFGGPCRCAGRGLGCPRPSRGKGAGAPLAAPAARTALPHSDGPLNLSESAVRVDPSIRVGPLQLPMISIDPTGPGISEWACPSRPILAGLSESKSRVMRGPASESGSPSESAWPVPAACPDIRVFRRGPRASIRPGACRLAGLRIRPLRGLRPSPASPAALGAGCLRNSEVTQTSDSDECLKRVTQTSDSDE